MPRPAKLPDLSDVDITELKLMILAALERHSMGPEWRWRMRGAQIGGMLDLCGGARQVIAPSSVMNSRRLTRSHRRRWRAEGHRAARLAGHPASRNIEHPFKKILLCRRCNQFTDELANPHIS